MFLVIFRNRKRAGIDTAAYGADAARMEVLARAQPGFLSFKSYTSDDGEVIAISEWENEKSAFDWGKNPQHVATQARGRAEYYRDYTLFTCDNPRRHHFGRTRD